MKKLILALIGIIFMVSMVNAQIQTHIVPDDYDTIQEAVDASNNGDFVKIRNGDYYESFDFPSGVHITVQGFYQSTSNSTIIHGDGNDNIIVDMFGCANFNKLQYLTLAGDNNTIGVRIGNSLYSEVKHNIIRNNDVGCLLTDTDYSDINNITSNKIYNNNVGVKALNDWQYSLRARIRYNCIYNNQYGIEISNNSSPNHLYIYNCTIADNEIAIACGQYQHFIEINSTIIWNNMDAFTNNQNNLYITYSGIQGGWAGEGNIDENPFFVDPANNDYSLQWNENNFSPCIDAGDPETEWDEDDTPPDMGAITAIEHSYFQDEYDGYEYDAVDWISYPVLNRITDNAENALNVLERQGLLNDNGIQTDDILECVWFEGIDKIWFDNGWQNDLGNFDSKQGYKV
ncbi:MAG: hypothetical protein U9P79_09125, partial [Candidatus Cloacimonadota bacterium]|nr:hypothetical protein [Candidatus Cloacimonadota bacterium]